MTTAKVRMTAKILKKGLSAAKYEMKLLLADYEYKKTQLDSIMEAIKSLCKKIPESEQMLAIKGIGVITVAGFFAEVGDVRRFESPRQIQKLARLSLRENSSGKHKGQTTISKRGRSVIAISCKLIRVFYAIVANGVAYDPEKTMSDIHRQPAAT